MKRFALVGVILLLLVTISGCNSSSPEPALSSGSYYAVGEYAEYLTPFLALDTDGHTFTLGAGTVFSYAEHGSIEIKDGEVIATSQSTTYVFEIIDSDTLLLIDNGDNEFFVLPENAEFVFGE